MASYCTRANLEDRIGATEVARLADADMDGAEDLETVARAIADTDAQISSKIAKRWPAYVGVATDELRRIACVLVEDALARGPMRTDDLIKRADRARADLAAIGDGRAYPSPDEAPADGDAGEVLWEAGRREFAGGGF